MSTTNTTYNPIFRATRAAFAELTTAEAQRWYGTQAKATAARASAISTDIHTISHLSIAAVTRLLQRKPALAAVEQVEIADTVDEAIASTEVIAESVQDEDVTELRPWSYAGREQTAVSEPEPSIALTEATAPAQAEAPAVWLAREAMGSVVYQPEQAISSTEVSSEAIALEQEHAPPVWAATEVNDSETASVKDERIEDALDLTIAAGDNPLPEGQIPFDEALECGPPFLVEEEDTSFYQAEDDEDADILTSDDPEPESSATTPDLSAMIQAYMQENSITAESSGEDAITHPSSTPDSVGGAAAFAWEEHQGASESAAEAESGK
jgi:hypothetical protein